MKNRAIRRALLLLPISAIIFLLVAGIHILATSQNTPIRVDFPDGFSYDSCELIANGENGFFVLAKNEEQSHIICLSSEGNALCSLTVDYSYQYAMFFNKKLYLIQPQASESLDEVQTKIYSYKCVDQSFRSYLPVVLNQIFCAASTDFAVDMQGNYYAIDDRDRSMIFMFDNSGEQIVSVTSLSGDYLSLCISPQNIMYTIYSNVDDRVGVLDLSKDILYVDLPLKQSDIPSPSFQFVTKSRVIDQNGTIFSVLESPVVFGKLFSAEQDGTFACMPTDDSLICKTETSEATEFTKNGRVKRYHFDGELADLCTSGERSAALFYQDDLLYLLDIRFVEQEELLPEDSSVSSESEEPSVPDQSSVPDQPLTDLVCDWKIDRSLGIVYVDAGITASMLKKSFQLTDDAELNLLKSNGTPFSSGNTATGTLVELIVHGQTVDSLVVVIHGDLDCTGTVTTKDKQLLYNTLNGENELDGIAFCAADLNHDGKLDTLDLVHLKRMIGP